MTSPDPGRSRRAAPLLAAAAGLAIGAVVFALSRGDDAPAVGVPSPSAAPLSRSSLPPEAAGTQGATYYAVFLAVAGDANDDTLVTAQRRAKALGYSGGIGDIGCTAGAREQLKLPAAGTYTAYSVFFSSPEHAARFAAAYGSPVVGIAAITAGCLD